MNTTAMALAVCGSLIFAAASQGQPYYARGEFNGWGDTHPMVDDGDGTHSLTISGFTPGQTFEFKIATQDWSFSQPGNNVKSVYNAAGEFTFHFLPGTFSDGWSPAANRVGYEDPQQFGWEVTGSFVDWGDGPQLVPQGNGLYALDHEIAAPGSYEFKFRRSGTWDFNFGADFGHDSDTAQFITTEENQTVRFELDFPNGAWRVVGADLPEPIKAAVYFEADMSVLTAAGSFDPNAHEIWARGNSMGWGDPPNDGLQLLEDGARPGIYTNVFRMESHVAGSNFEYKFTIWNPGTFQTTWEDGDNRVVVFTGAEPVDADDYHQITASRFFNDQSPEDLLAEDTLVTFRVDMTGAQTVGPDPAPFAPGEHDLYVNGNFALWWEWGPFPPGEFQLFDDGVSGGDATAGDLIYTMQRMFPAGSSTRLVYKYAIMGGDNEAVAFNDRIRYIRGTGTYVLPLDVFGDMVKEEAVEQVGSLAISAVSGGNITLSWNGAAGVRLQRATSLTDANWEDVADTDGASSKEVPAGSEAEFFRLIRP